MAIYHLSAKVISRASGRSAVAAAAYRSGRRLRDERQGLDHDFSRKGGVDYTEILAPADAPDWMHDRAALWNAVEAVERRKDAQLAREIEVSLPRELSDAQQLELVRTFVVREFVARGMIADLAIHRGKARDGKGQPHAHVLLTMRELTGAGFGKKDREWNAADLLIGWREAWAQDLNQALERHGHAERVDHRSLETQRETAQQEATQAREAGDNVKAEIAQQKAAELDREPEPKVGAFAHQLEKLGIETRRGDLRRQAYARNVERTRVYKIAWRAQRELAQFLANGREKLAALWHRCESAFDATKNRKPDPHGLAILGQSPGVEPDHLLPNRDSKEISRRAVLGQGKAITLPEIEDRNKILGRGSNPEKSTVLPKNHRDRDR